jgi:transposase-like protein
MVEAQQLARLRLRDERRSARVISGVARKRGPQPKISDAEIPALVEEWRAGTAVDEIARRFNVAEITIYRSLKRAERHLALLAEQGQPDSAPSVEPASRQHDAE